MSAGPPVAARWLLERVLPPGEFREAMLGDLEEEFATRARARRAWYWRQVLGLTPRLVWARLRSRRFPPSVLRGNATARQESFADAITHDTRYAFRMLARRPTFAAVALLTIALGIGSATAIFSVVDGVLLRGLPYRSPEQLVRVHRTFPHWRADPALQRDWDRISLSYPDYRDWRAQQRSYGDVAAWNWTSGTSTDAAGSEIMDVLQATASLLPTLGAAPQLGRNFLAEDEGFGKPRVALIGDRLWRERFGASGQALGKTLTLNGEPYTIIGVLPARFHITGLRLTPDLWVPAGSGSLDSSRVNLNYSAIARLKHGVTIEQAEQETSRIFQFGRPADEGGARLVSWQSDVTRNVRRPFLLLLYASALLLLITCVNVAALLLGEGAARAAELVARSALGAGRNRIVRQLLNEQLVLAALGALLGLLFSVWATRTLIALAPPFTPRLDEAGVNLRSFAFALGAASVTGIVFGLAPALTLARTDAGMLLRMGSMRWSRRRGSLRRAAVAVQLGLAVVMLVGATLLVRSLQRLTSVSPGFSPEQLLYVQPQLEWERFPEPTQYRAYFERAVAALAALPGVQEASAVSSAPFTDGGSGTTIRLERAGVEHETNAQWRVVFPEFQSTLSIPMAAGRTINADDGATTQPVALVNEAMAQQYWPDQSALGQRLQIDRQWHTVVGVVGNVKHFGLDQTAQSTFYVPAAQTNRRGLVILLRTAGSANALASAARARLRELDPTVAVRSVELASQLVDRTLADERFRTIVTTFFALVAALLTAAGLYGITADSVTQRLREMAIRIALGASPKAVLRLTVLGTFVLGLAGALAGALVAVVATRVLRPFLFGITPLDPTTYVFVLGGTVLSTIGAAWLPARRAARAQPAQLLKSE